jgi:hypothetical protein
MDSLLFMNSTRLLKGLGQEKKILLNHKMLLKKGTTYGEQIILEINCLKYLNI